jgi:hypothetical protein
MMSLQHRLKRIESHLHQTIGVCRDCGKSKDEWFSCLVLHADRDYSNQRLCCATCHSYPKILIFDDALYQQELARTQPPGSRVKVL